MITSFTGKHAFLSNFAPSTIRWAGREWATAEHLYQARKTYPPHSHEIREAATPSIAKKLGQTVPLLSYWDDIKVDVMREVVEAKFYDNPKLVDKLTATGNEVLVEGNTWHDQFWGNCTCPRHKDASGVNALGIILMNTRLDWLTEA